MKFFLSFVPKWERHIAGPERGRVCLAEGAARLPVQEIRAAKACTTCDLCLLSRDALCDSNC